VTQQFRYAVIGAGRQGTAAAYDMAKWGGAASVLMADYDAGQATRAAERINTLTGRSVATSAQINARDEDALVNLLDGIDVFLAATPFIYLLACTRAAIRSGASMVDLGGHTDTVLQQMSMSDEANAAGVAIIPDCGMGPGMNNTMGLYTVERLQALGATPREVRLWDGGLPQNPPEPWGYQCSFHINGLTNEYDGKALVLRDGRVTHVWKWSNSTALASWRHSSPLAELRQSLTPSRASCMCTRTRPVAIRAITRSSEPSKR
jgi:lysine 6-dehydrogenase